MSFVPVSKECLQGCRSHVCLLVAIVRLTDDILSLTSTRHHSMRHLRSRRMPTTQRKPHPDLEYPSTLPSPTLGTSSSDTFVLQFVVWIHPFLHVRAPRFALMAGYIHPNVPIMRQYPAHLDVVRDSCVNNLLIFRRPSEAASFRSSKPSNQVLIAFVDQTLVVRVSRGHILNFDSE